MRSQASCAYGARANASAEPFIESGGRGSNPRPQAWEASRHIIDMACKSDIFGGSVECRYSAGTANSCRSTWGPLGVRARLSGRGGHDRGTRLNSLAAWRVLRSVTTGEQHEHACPAMQTRSHQYEPTSGTRSRDGRSTARRSEPLTTAEAAAALGVHERTVRRYLSSGLLAFRRLPGGHYRIPAEALAEFWRANVPSGRGYPVPLVDQTPSALKASRQVRQRSPSSGKQRRLGVEAPREYDLSPATLRAVRSRLSETPAPSTVGSTGALVSDG
jgi:excisionase family DNA binding protein